MPAGLLRRQPDGVAVADGGRQPQGVAVVELAQPAVGLGEALARGGGRAQQRRHAFPLVFELSPHRRLHGRDVGPRHLLEAQLAESLGRGRGAQRAGHQGPRQKRPAPHSAPSTALPDPWVSST